MYCYYVLNVLLIGTVNMIIWSELVGKCSQGRQPVTQCQVSNHLTKNICKHVYPSPDSCSPLPLTHLSKNISQHVPPSRWLMQGSGCKLGIRTGGKNLNLSLNLFTGLQPLKLLVVFGSSIIKQITASIIKATLVARRGNPVLFCCSI